jgi:hypothetical protein
MITLIRCFLNKGVSTDKKKNDKNSENTSASKSCICYIYVELWIVLVCLCILKFVVLLHLVLYKKIVYLV